jgi:golgi-specific brefeldin A-resistance guanine nucleotide exchange factor 1
MESFAGRLFEQLEVGKPFENADTVFILSFSTIMLNTDLHNPHIAMNKKMTKEEFIRNNRGINNHNDLPRDYLENIYDEIKSNQIQVLMDVLDSTANIDYTDSETWNKLMDRVAQDKTPVRFTPTTMALRLHQFSSSSNAILSHEVDMFLVMAKPTFESILMLWQYAQDDLLMRRYVSMLSYFYQDKLWCLTKFLFCTCLWIIVEC